MRPAWPERTFAQMLYAAPVYVYVYVYACMLGWVCVRVCLCVFVCVNVCGKQRFYCLWFDVYNSKGCGQDRDSERDRDSRAERQGQGDCSMKDDDDDDDAAQAATQWATTHLRQQQVISINLMVFHLQPKLNRLFAVKNFELRWERKSARAEQIVRGEWQKGGSRGAALGRALAVAGNPALLKWLIQAKLLTWQRVLAVPSNEGSL